MMLSRHRLQSCRKAADAQGMLSCYRFEEGKPVDEVFPGLALARYIVEALRKDPTPTDGQEQPSRLEVRGATIRLILKQYGFPYKPLGNVRFCLHLRHPHAGLRYLLQASPCRARYHVGAADWYSGLLPR